ncbi:polysaccharide biosynthesis protein [Myxococcota bacterium]
MYRLIARSAQNLIDLAVLSLAYWGAFVLRFDGEFPLDVLKRAGFAWPYVVGLQFLSLHVFAVPQFAWRYVGLREVERVLWATGGAAILLLTARVVSQAAQPNWGYAVYAFLPLGVILVDFVLAFLGTTGVRVLRRLQGERTAANSLRPRSLDQTPTLLVGAGQAGVTVAREIAARPDLGLLPVGFLDDDARKVGTIIQGIRVLGTTAEVAGVAGPLGARQAIITISVASGASIRRIVRHCEQAGLRVKVIPGLFEILDGKVNLSRIRDVSIEDLLRRTPVTLELGLIRDFLQTKRVLVTGAGGSIGSELCRQVARFRPKELILVEQCEYALFCIHQELTQRHLGLNVVPKICDICDSQRVDEVFSSQRPEVVFHAAAHKHVPMMEWNPGEAIKNNVFGTRKVAEAADRFRVGAFVMVSTDKAVNPTSVMGATKRVAEMIVQSLSERSATKYVVVRFGNVLGSTGSVVPIFKQQIATGGPVTVTHPEMKRYFMTIPEACQLVMQSAAMGKGGEIFVLDMGEPVRIAELAEELIRLSGFEPGRDIEIRFTGTRPGEKLFEEFGFDGEQMTRTAHAKIYQGRLSPCDPEDVDRCLGLLARYTGSSSTEEVRNALARVIPEMRLTGAPDEPKSESDKQSARVPGSAPIHPVPA